MHEGFGLVGSMLGEVGIDSKVGLWACHKEQGEVGQMWLSPCGI